MDYEIGPEQHQQAGDSQPQADFSSQCDVVIAQQQRVEHQKPERCHGDDQRRQAGRHMLLRVGESQVATHEQQHSDNRHPRQLRRTSNESLRPRSPQNASMKTPAIGEAYAAHQGGRNVLDCDVDAEIGGSPEEIDQREGEDHGEAMLALSLGHVVGYWESQS